MGSSAFQRLINASALPDARFRREVHGGKDLRARPVKAVRTWPPVIAADAGPMQIQWWEGAALSFAQTVQQDTTQRHCVLGNWLRRKSVGESVPKSARRKRLIGRQGRKVRGAPQRVEFSSWRSSLTPSGDHRWGTKLDFGWG